MLAEFGRTARIGPVGCGASLPDMAEVLGPPFVGDRVYEDRRWPRWFGYGSLQLVVCRCRLVTQVILPVWAGKVTVPNAGTDALVSCPSDVTYSRLTAALDSSGNTGRTWSLVQDTPGQCTVEIEADGIRTAFVFVTVEDYDEPPLADPKLYKVVSSAFHDCPPVTPGHEDEATRPRC
ncbi:hypothetical protein GCM10010507_20330 [Streptomyces cinnamoneus]|uniref:Uncharacterized protein n=2 Tax=Streptomyces cinnamoneus TaxID=53446 RepID=A0A918TEP7_STRCJ|nr:hypothetical protein GCM10010507_20330 [Streptomyces cinnamoneus]